MFKVFHVWSYHSYHTVSATVLKHNPTFVVKDSSYSPLNIMRSFPLPFMLTQHLEYTFFSSVKQIMVSLLINRRLSLTSDRSSLLWSPFKFFPDRRYLDKSQSLCWKIIYFIYFVDSIWEKFRRKKPVTNSFSSSRATKIHLKMFSYLTSIFNRDDFSPIAHDFHFTVSLLSKVTINSPL